jgi:DNA-binding NarL/FixJ family response regulator
MARGELVMVEPKQGRQVTADSQESPDLAGTGAISAGSAGPADSAEPTEPADRTEPLPGTVRLVLVDDHRLFRAGVRAELAEVSDGSIEIVGEAEDAPSAIAVIATTQPDVVLLDVHLPGGGGIEVLHQSTAPGIRFLALSVSDAAEDVIGVVRGGARGYVTKSISGAELADAIRRVAGGDAVFSPRLAGFVLDAFSAVASDSAGSEAGGEGAADPAVDPEFDRLTGREREVLRLIARGYAYKEIARELVISVKTVESHVSSVLRKLQLSSRYELTRWASERRLL